MITQVAEPLGGLPMASLQGAPQIRRLALRHRKGRNLPPGPHRASVVWCAFSKQPLGRSTLTYPGFRAFVWVKKIPGKILRDWLHAGHQGSWEWNGLGGAHSPHSPHSCMIAGILGLQITELLWRFLEPYAWVPVWLSC